MTVCESPPPNQIKAPAVTNHTQIPRFPEPTLNEINTSTSNQPLIDFNKSFDNFVQNIKLASNGEVNWNLNEIDTSDFQSKSTLLLFCSEQNILLKLFILIDLVENMKSGDKNNWNMSSDQFVNFASSLSSFLAQSIKLQKTGNGNDQINNYEANVKHIKSELTSFNHQINNNQSLNSNHVNNDLSLNINLNDSQLKLPIEIINSLCNTSNTKVRLMLRILLYESLNYLCLLLFK